MQAMRIPRERPPKVRPPNCNWSKATGPNLIQVIGKAATRQFSHQALRHSGFYNPVQKLFPLVGELLNSTILFKPVRLATPGKTAGK